MTWKAEEDDAFAAALQDYDGRRQAHDTAFDEAMARRRELEGDEQWKQQNCRRCPHCRQVINRLSGCNSMVCGVDHDTSANTQPGCGRRFDWTAALPYQAEVADSAPAAFDETAPGV